MNQAGGLKKRRKRKCIAKVNGMGANPYDEASDNFTGSNMYEPSTYLLSRRSAAKVRVMTANENETRINIGQINGNRSGNSSRITRNPEFHIPMHEERFTSTPPDFKTKFENMEKTVFEEFDFDEDINNLHPDPNHKRPYFLNERTMNRLRYLLVLGKASGAIPWYWNKATNQVDKFSPKYERLWFHIFNLLNLQTFLLTVFNMYAFFYRLETGSYREKFSFSFRMVWFGSAIVFNINMYIYGDNVRQYINSLLYMNKKLVDRYVLNADDYVDSGRVLVNVSIITNMIQVFISVSLYLKVPFMPWFLYSYIYSPDNPWYWLIPGALHEFMLVGQVITNYMLLGWVIIAHANSVSFFLKECHNNNESDFTRDDIRDPNHAMRIYRTLQILCQAFNDCMAPIAVPMVKIIVWIGTVPTGYVLIRSMNHIFIDEFPGILTYPFALVDCITGGFAVLSVGAEMYDLGVSFIESWGLTRQKDFRRILMSCPTLKCKVGSLYAITVSTTITFFKSVLDYITDCIITF